MWVARDKTGYLYLYNIKPEKGTVQWQIPSYESEVIIKIDSALLPEVKWEDEKPTEVEIVPKQVVQISVENNSLIDYVTAKLNQIVTVDLDGKLTGKIVGYSYDTSNRPNYVIIEVFDRTGWKLLKSRDVILSEEVKNKQFLYVSLERLRKGWVEV